MQLVEAVVWDLGGVLVRTEDRTPRRIWERRLGLDQDALEAFVFGSEISRRAEVGDAEVQDIWDDLSRRLNLSPDQIAQLRQDFWRGDQLDANLVERIRQLRSKHRTGLITNAFKDIRRAIEDDWHLDEIFDAILISAEIGLAKPDPAIYRMLLDQWSLDPGAAVFIDDFAENIAAARSLGMQAIHFRDPGQALSDLDKLLAG
jgi:epoxide hydrolase-like predicted phosphatase